MLGLEDGKRLSRGCGPAAGTRRVPDAFPGQVRRCRTTCVFCREQSARTRWDEDGMCPSWWGVVKLGGG